jgi:hypothetical protein
MKKIILAFCCLLSGYSYAQVITDGSFENWTTELLYEDLEWWESGASEGAIVLKSTDRVEGEFSAYLETSVDAVSGDTLLGFVLYGEFGDEGPESGLPFLSPADTVKASVKYDVMPGDSAILLVSFLKLGVVQSMDVFSFTGTQNTWTEVSFPLSIGANAADRDSVVIAIASSNALGEVGITPGSWIMVDDVHFTSSITPVVDDVRNGGFENWFDVEVEDLDNWSTFNYEVVRFGQALARKVAGSQIGTFAVRLETIEVSYGGGSSDTIRGYISNGFFETNDSTSNLIPLVYTGPIAGRLSGDFKFSPAGANESAFVAINFFKEGEFLDQYGYEFNTFTPVYTAFDFDYVLSQMPDSFEVSLFAGNIPGSSLIMDNLAISDITAIDNYEALKTVDITVFPNPAKEILNVSIDGVNDKSSAFKIIDVLGNEVANVSLILRGNKLIGSTDLNELSSGVYFYQFTQNNEVLKAGKFTKL